MARRLLVPLLLLLLSGCATLPVARPLEPGLHEVGVSIGGPVLRAFGGAIPVPNLVVQGRHGLAAPLNRPLDLTYGLNLIALPYGVLQGHVGASWLLIHQAGPAPALAFAYQQYFATNAIGLPNKPFAEAQGWTANRLELAFSWEIERQLIHAGIAQYFDFANPKLTLTPSFGVVLDTSPRTPGGLKFHFDFRWYAVTQRDLYDAVRWIPPGVGAFGFTGGMSFVIDKRPRPEPEEDES